MVLTEIWSEKVVMEYAVGGAGPVGRRWRRRLEWGNSAAVEDVLVVVLMNVSVLSPRSWADKGRGPGWA